MAAETVRLKNNKTGVTVVTTADVAGRLSGFSPEDGSSRKQKKAEPAADAASEATTE